MDNDAAKVEDSDRRPKPDRWKLSIVLGILILLTIGNYVATAILFTLIKRHPEWLIALSPTTRNLLLVSQEMPALVYFALACCRRMLPHPLWFLIGRWYGNAGIRWVQRRSPDVGAMVTTLETHFPKYGWLICTLYPHPLVCTMAGASKMRFAPFFAFNTIGILGFVWASYAFGDFLHPVTSSVADFGQRYWIPLTVLTVAMVLVGLFAGERNGRSKIESIGRIESELDHESSSSSESESH